MATTRAIVTWVPSVSPDVVSQRIDVIIDGGVPVSTDLTPNITSFEVEVPEGSHLHVEVTASDGVNRSNPAVAEATAPDVTAPEAPTDVQITFQTL